MTNADLDSLALLVSEHKWLAVSAIVIGAACRVLKTEMAGEWFRDLHPLVKRLFPIGLGLLSGFAEAAATGKPMDQALVSGVASGLMAMLGHEVLVEGLRQGKELGS